MSAQDPQLLIPHTDWQPAVLPLLAGMERLAVGSLRRDYHPLQTYLVAADLRPTERVCGDDQLPGADWLVVTAQADFRTPEVCLQRLRPWRSQLLAVLVIGLEP